MSPAAAAGTSFGQKIAAKVVRTPDGDKQPCKDSNGKRKPASGEGAGAPLLYTASGYSKPRHGATGEYEWRTPDLDERTVQADLACTASSTWGAQYS